MKKNEENPDEKDASAARARAQQRKNQLQTMAAQSRSAGGDPELGRARKAQLRALRGRGRTGLAAPGKGQDKRDGLAQAGLDDASVRRRRELFRMRDHLRNDESKGDVHNAHDAHGQDEDLRKFMATLLERKDQRKHQLAMVKSFLDDPLRFGIKTEGIPSSSTAEEIEARKREIQYRIDLLSTLLEMSDGEMEMLTQAEAADFPASDDDKPDEIEGSGAG